MKNRFRRISRSLVMGTIGLFSLSPSARAETGVARLLFGPCKEDPVINLKVNVTIATQDQQAIAHGTANGDGELILLLQGIEAGEQLEVRFQGNESGEWHDCNARIAKISKDGIEEYVMIMSSRFGTNCAERRWTPSNYFVCNVETLDDDGDIWNLIETNDL